MIATIQKTDSDGMRSTFTIVGTCEYDIEDQVYELQEWARRDSIYPDCKYEVLDYGNNVNAGKPLM